ICVAKDHSTHLVGIVDTFGDPPFGLVHHLFTFYLQHLRVMINWALGNCSAICRLLPFLADLISSFGAQHTGTLGEVRGLSVTRLMD
ncbi:hypothetical protein MTR67_012010, partial [Solanum verrucosum]